ncbi:DUF5677 domain-containing protein [Sphingomonas sp.]|uniref:DUF5677 domain-containing protein n=1 Tax=Sphingomonas sp. TaxID=28214 RepID=UPI00389EFD90
MKKNEPEDGAQLSDWEALDTAGFEKLTNPQLTQFYLRVRREFRDLLKRARRISLGSGGVLSTGNRMFWASVLFTRICVISKSIDHLLPNPKPREHWDFGSVASLTRNLQEAGLIYYWLCGPGIDEQVRAGRFILLQLHDYGSRRRLYPKEFPEGDNHFVFRDLVSKFDKNPFLASLGERERRVALRGEKSPFIQDDVLTEMGVDPQQFRTLYRFFSQHTHTGPIAFYRMAEHARGSGVETRMEKQYMIIAVGAAAESLARAIDVHLDVFPDAETREPHLTDRQIEANVERDQGRRHRTR